MDFVKKIFCFAIAAVFASLAQAQALSAQAQESAAQVSAKTQGAAWAATDF